MRWPKRPVRHDALGTLTVGVALLVLFLTVPLRHVAASPWWLFVLAGASLALFLVALIRMIAHGTTLFRLLNLLLTVVFVFAFGFYSIAINRPGEFEGIQTRIDAFYFTLTTMTTTGYGDIHATGQLSRSLVSLALVFDIVFLGAFGAELSRLMGRRGDKSKAAS